MPIDRRTVIIGAASFAAIKAAGSVPADTGEAQVKSPAEVKSPTQVTAPVPGSSPPERVLGIGGLFFRSRDPKTLAQWYQDHLGIDPVPTDYGHLGWQQAAGPTAFAPFPMDTHYLGPPQQTWMVNFRVRSLDAMVAQLSKAGIEVKVDPDKYPNGRFARLHDPEGNPIELWEPQP
jgi:catechol 2,3-dioxygenase-like lactoylglutathione lyase family enzyme